jgi:hypothetical protein
LAGQLAVARHLGVVRVSRHHAIPLGDFQGRGRRRGTLGAWPIELTNSERPRRDGSSPNSPGCRLRRSGDLKQLMALPCWYERCTPTSAGSRRWRMRTRSLRSLGPEASSQPMERDSIGSAEVFGKLRRIKLVHPRCSPLESFTERRTTL